MLIPKPLPSLPTCTALQRPATPSTRPVPHVDASYSSSRPVAVGSQRPRRCDEDEDAVFHRKGHETARCGPRIPPVRAPRGAAKCCASLAPSAPPPYHGMAPPRQHQIDRACACPLLPLTGATSTILAPRPVAWIMD
jgi:hypothetical protein